LASDGSFFIFMSGFPTGDLHPIYIAPMLGTHKPVDATARSPVVKPMSTAPTHHL